MTMPRNLTPSAIQSAARSALADVFNAAAARHARFHSVPVYTVDWDNLDNDGFLRNAQFRGVRAVVSGLMPVDAQGNTPGAIDLRVKNNGLAFAGMTYRPHDGGYSHADRLKDALAFADRWRRDNGVEQYAAPRLIEMPSVKMSALWLDGPKPAFIPVAEFHTEMSDPLAVEEGYLDRLRQAVAKQRAAWKGLDGLPPPGG